MSQDRKLNLFHDMVMSGPRGVCPVCGVEVELKRAILVVNRQGGVRILFHGNDTICYMPHQDEVLMTNDKGRWFIRPRDGRDEE